MVKIMTSDKSSQSGTSNAAEAAESSQARALACARAAIDKKAENTKILDLTEISGFTDYFIIASGASGNNTQKI